MDPHAGMGYTHDQTLHKRCCAVMLIAAGTIVAAQQPQKPPPAQGSKDTQAFRFRTGVELDQRQRDGNRSSGRFVPGLTKDDFRVYDDERPSR